jgi:hypothetical protein
MVLVKPNAKPKTNIMAENCFMSDHIVEHLPIIGLREKQKFMLSRSPEVNPSLWIQ